MIRHNVPSLLVSLDCQIESPLSRSHQAREGCETAAAVAIECQNRFDLPAGALAFVDVVGRFPWQDCQGRKDSATC